MKPFAKLMIGLLVVVGIALPMLMKGPNGKPIMTVDDWIPDVGALNPQNISIDDGVERLKSLAKIEPAREPSEQGSVQAAATPSKQLAVLKSGEMYKWQDAQGRWHFSNEKPVDSVAVSVQELPEMENLMQAPVKEQEKSSSISLPGGFGL